MPMPQPMPFNHGALAAGAERAGAADVVEAEQLQAVAPAERVLEIDERHRVADLLLEVVADHRPDAANPELALRRQDAVGPAADRADTEILMGRQREPRPAADDVPLEIEVAVQPRRRDLRRPVDAPQRRPIAPVIRIAQALAEWRLELMPAIGRFERFLIEAASVDRRADAPPHSCDRQSRRRFGRNGSSSFHRLKSLSSTSDSWRSPRQANRNSTCGCTRSAPPTCTPQRR